MPEVFCAHCRETLEVGARFCPRCGKSADKPLTVHDLPADEEQARRKRIARREVILGWVFLLTGLGLMLALVYGQASWQKVTGGLLGAVLSLLGLGCLIGDSGKSTK